MSNAGRLKAGDKQKYTILLSDEGERFLLVMSKARGDVGTSAIVEEALRRMYDTDELRKIYERNLRGSSSFLASMPSLQNAQKAQKTDADSTNEAGRPRTRAAKSDGAGRSVPTRGR